MMLKVCTNSLIALLIAFPAFAQENIATMGEENISVLNEELRKNAFRVGKATKAAANNAASIALLEDEFNSSSGHDHDGVDSKKVLVTNLDATGITADYILYSNGSGIVGRPFAVSNVVFSFGLDGNGGSNGTSYWGIFSALTEPSAAGGKYSWGARNSSAESTPSTYRTVLTSKFKKIAGLNTVTVYVKLALGVGASGAMFCVVDIGGQTGGTSHDDSTFTWKSFTIDVSSLTAGQVYDVEIDINAAESSGATFGFMNSIIAFAS